ncbi:DUF2939 domain-containing protein [Acetobacter ghanensis]|uniref:DUF2939 domain-containing protein n=1 Tax=Acetobacter ghanensis TaxID=431306 RepID=UPI003D33BEF1
MTTSTQPGPTIRPASLPRRQTARRVCVATAAASFGLYLASPFVTLWSAAIDLQHHDATALGRMINWAALDASLKRQTLAGLHLNMQPAADELPEFGSSFASTAVSNAVDTTVTQANLGTLIDEAMPATPAAAQAAPSFASLATRASVHFNRLDQFVMELPLPGHERETPLRVELRIQGWHWKINNVELPMRREPIMQAAATPSNA